MIGTVPFAYLFTRVPMHYLVPGLQVAWGVFTLVQFRGNSYGAFMAFRFFVGLFEVRSRVYCGIYTASACVLMSCARGRFMLLCSMFLGLGVRYSTTNYYESELPS